MYGFHVTLLELIQTHSLRFPSQLTPVSLLQSAYHSQLTTVSLLQSAYSSQLTPVSLPQSAYPSQPTPVSLLAFSLPHLSSLSFRLYHYHPICLYIHWHITPRPPPPPPVYARIFIEIVFFTFICKMVTLNLDAFRNASEV